MPLLWLGAELLGYFVLMVAAGEAHLLNLSIAAAHQRRGHGSALLREAAELARRLGARSLFLEVRPSNRGAQALYTRFGFRKIARAPRLLPRALRARGRAGADAAAGMSRRARGPGGDGSLAGLAFAEVEAPRRRTTPFRRRGSS